MRGFIHSTLCKRGGARWGVKEKRSAGLDGFMSTCYACASTQVGPLLLLL